MDEIVRRTVEVNFTEDEMKGSFISLEEARLKRDYSKFEGQEEQKSEIKEVKDLFDKQQKLDRMIRKSFKLTKFYRHCDSIFHIVNKEE